MKKSPVCLPVLLGLLVATVAVPCAEAAPLPSLTLKQEVLLSEELSRESRTGDAAGGVTVAERLEKSARALRLGRQKAAGASQGPRRHEAFYLDALLMARFGTIYDLLFESEKKKAFESEVVGIKLSTLFDGFLEMIQSGQVSESMKPAASQVGSCLAHRMLVERPTCELDDATGDSPSTLKLGWYRLTCGKLANACKVRRAFFAAAKPALEAARKDPEVQKQIRDTFEKVFPERFRVGLLRQISELRGTYTEWVARKFLAAKTPPTPTLLPDGEEAMFIADEDVVGIGPAQRMDGLAYGLRADLALARMGSQLLSGSTRALRPSIRAFVASETAAAFWSAVQQILVLTGGTKAIFDRDSRAYELIEGDLGNLPPRFSKESPYLKGELFGGWGVSMSDQALRFEPWDWETYLNLPAEKGAPVRFLPHLFKVDRLGRPSAVGPESAIQSLEDQAALLDSLGEFLEMSQEGGTFASLIGSEDSLVDLMDASKPVLLPAQSRLLAYAMVAGIVRNLIHPDFALVEKQPTIEPGQGLGVKFFETSSLENPERPQARTSSLARLILAAAKLRERISGDPQYPGTDRKAVIDQLDTLIQIGALTLGAQSQNPDGGFRPVLNGPNTRTDLLSTVLSLRAIQTAHYLSGMKALTLNLKAGVESLKKALPPMESSRWIRGETRVALWHFMIFWDQAKPEWSEAILGPEGHEMRRVWERKLLETLN